MDILRALFLRAGESVNRTKGLSAYLRGGYSREIQI